MAKNSERFENDTTHFSYKDYRKKVTHKGPNRYLVVFVSVFIAGLLVILGLAKVLSPNVDVGVGGYDDDTEYVEEGGTVDERLKRIQMEDSGELTSEGDLFSPELDERVVIPDSKQSKKEEINPEPVVQHKETEQKIVKEEVKPSPAKVHESSAPAPEPVKAAAPTVNARVVVGYYQTEKQAEVAKSIMQDAGIGVVPIVKNMNGYYTLHVGSYSSRDKAQQVVNNLLKNNYPARLIVD